MPLFTPDINRVSKLGRPWDLWFTSSWFDAITLIRKHGVWAILEAPSDAELADTQKIYQQRDNYVSYDQVRDLNLTDVGSVRYVDDYDDRFSDEFISRDNTPFDRASGPEPIH